MLKFILIYFCWIFPLIKIPRFINIWHLCRTLPPPNYSDPLPIWRKIISPTRQKHNVIFTGLWNTSLVILREYVAASGLRRFCWITRYNSIKNPIMYWTKRIFRQRYWWVLHVGVASFIHRDAQWKILNELWLEALVEPCFVLFLLNLLVRAPKFYSIQLKLRKYSLCVSETYFLLRTFSARFHSSRKFIFTKSFTKVRLRYSKSVLQRTKFEKD